MATSQHYEDTRDDANLLLSKLDDLLWGMERSLIPSMNATFMSIARHLSPPSPLPRKVIQARKEINPSAASTDSTNESKATMSAISARTAPAEGALSKNRSLNCQDSGTDPRKKTKVRDGNDERKGNEIAKARFTKDAERNDGNDALKTTEREESNEPVISSQSYSKLAVNNHPPLSAPSPPKCYEDALRSQVGSNISREEVLSGEEADPTEENNDTRFSASSKKRQRGASVPSNDTPPRKKVRTDSEPLAPEALAVAPPPLETRQGAAPNYYGSIEDGSLQASIASEIIREELQKHKVFINDMQNQVYNSLDELKAQKWLLWYRLCCCTVVSSKKYSYRGRVRQMEERTKYDELKEVFERADKLYGYCSELVERAKDAVWSASQARDRDW